jgi:histidinol-phosphatase (PHP family)
LHIRFDYHTHPQGLRVQRYRNNLLSNWVEAAESLGLEEVAFTDHSACCGGIDFEQIELVQNQFPRVRLRAGIELDNGPDAPLVLKWVERNFEHLDITLAAVTSIGGWTFTHPAHQEEWARRDPERLLESYYHEMRLLLATGVVDCITQFDLIKIVGTRPATDFSEELNDIFELIHSAAVSIQICSSGYRYPVREAFPSAAIIAMAKEWKIPFTVGSGAHTFTQLADNYERLAFLLAETGITQLAIYEKHKPTLVNLPQ